VRARCLIVDMSCGQLASPELARAVARQIERARHRGYGVAIVSPGPEVARAIAATGSSRAVELMPTVDEALARVRGRLTPRRTITVRAA
jgi:uroporphyrinogen-III synthase